MNEHTCRQKNQPDDSNRKKNQAEVLLELVEGIPLFQSPERVSYVEVEGRAFEATSSRVRQLLVHRYYQRFQRPPTVQSVKDVQGVLEARASHEGAKYPVYTRIANCGDRIYFNLGNSTGGVVEVTGRGWQVVENCPVKFREPAGFKPLPTPEKGGTLEELRQLLNVGNSQNWILLIGWLIVAMFGKGPYFVLLVYGEQGSAKSSLVGFVRGLIDPNVVPLRCPPREERDLMIWLKNSFVVVLDNVSSIRQSLSDALCRLATGGGISFRKLYTDDSEAFFEGKRPVALTAIETVAERSDLVDRSVILNLPPVPVQKRKTEQELEAEFERIRPGILGALFDLLVVALRNRADVKLKNLPRMADAAKLVTACENKLGWESGTFLSVYSQNRASAVASTLDNSLIASKILELMRTEPLWSGSPSDLYERLDSLLSERERRSREWPKSANWLTRKLKPFLTFLRESRIEIKLPEDCTRSDQRQIEIENESLKTTVDTVDGVEAPKVRSNGTDAKALSADDIPGLSSDSQYTNGALSDDTDATDAKSPQWKELIV